MKHRPKSAGPQSPSPVGSILSGAFAGTPLGKRLADIRVWQVWSEAVGERIARVARPLSMRDGVLTVGVTNAPWLQQLRFLKREIIERLNDRTGEPLVRDIFFKSGTIPGRGEDEAPPPPLPPLPGDVVRAIERGISLLPDRELAERFRKLLAARSEKGTNHIPPNGSPEGDDTLH